MRTVKSEKCLRLERDSQREYLTLDESLPEIQRIADENGLSLSKDWTEVMRIYNQENLNR